MGFPNNGCFKGKYSKTRSSAHISDDGQMSLMSLLTSCVMRFVLQGSSCIYHELQIREYNTWDHYRSTSDIFIQHLTCMNSERLLSFNYKILIISFINTPVL